MRKASPEIRRRLSNNLKRLRGERCYTQEDLAEFSGLNKNYISNVEQATVNVTLASLEALAKGLDCEEEELLRRPSVKGPEPVLSERALRYAKRLEGNKRLAIKFLKKHGFIEKPGKLHRNYHGGGRS